jgi:hypothetical protein
MPVYPLTPVRPVATGYYPHMAKHDAVIWERFLARYAHRIAAVAYDVALGGLIVTVPDADDEGKRAFQYATALKIDAVALLEREVWVIEVKPHAGVSAIGAALAYTTLAKLDPFTDKPLIPVVVTDYASADIEYCCRELKVLLIQMQPTGEPQPGSRIITTV